MLFGFFLGLNLCFFLISFRSLFRSFLRFYYGRFFGRFFLSFGFVGFQGLFTSWVFWNFLISLSIFFIFFLSGRLLVSLFSLCLVF